tara:strand:- start:7375 stop:7530 length:156 start_codon:yes stop_codon:yes gene_type:complete
LVWYVTSTGNLLIETPLVGENIKRQQMKRRINAWLAKRNIENTNEKTQAVK